MVISDKVAILCVGPEIQIPVPVSVPCDEMPGKGLLFRRLDHPPGSHMNSIFMRANVRLMQPRSRFLACIAETKS